MDKAYLGIRGKGKYEEGVLVTLLSVLFPFYILLSPYEIFGLNLCYWIFTPLILALVMLKRSIKLNKNWALFVFYIIFIQIVTMLFNRYDMNYQTTKLVIIFTILSTFFVAGFSSFVNFDKMYKIYSILSWICIGVLFLQSFELYVLGKPVEPILLFKEFHTKDITLITTSRPSAFFNEPQHFASFLMPFLVLILEKNKKLCALIISFAIFLSGSAQGIIISMFVWLYYTFKTKGKTKILIIMLFVGLITVISNLGIFESYFSRIINMDLSNELRVVRGFGIYYDLPLIDKMLGISTISVNDFILKTGYGLEWYRDPTYFKMALDFVSSFSATFLYYGFFGGLLFSMVMIKCALISREARCLVLVVIISAFSQTLLFNSWYVFYYSLIFMAMRFNFLK